MILFSIKKNIFSYINIYFLRLFGHHKKHRIRIKLTSGSLPRLGVTLELRRTGGGGFTVLTDERRAMRDIPIEINKYN